jgi:hypothetical protein
VTIDAPSRQLRGDNFAAISAWDDSMARRGDGGRIEGEDDETTRLAANWRKLAL